MRLTSTGGAARIADWVTGLLVQGRLPTTLSAAGIAAPDVAALAAAAADQWTGGFNPRPVDASVLAGLYEAAR